MNYDLGLVRTDRGLRIEIGRAVAVPAATVFEVLTSVDEWEAWGPPVTDVEYPEETISAGTTGRVQTLGFCWVPFRVETVSDSEWTWTA